MELLRAVNENNVEQVKEFLKNRRTKINYTDNHNFSALHHAVLRRNLQICEILLRERNFNPEIRTYEGCTALMIAIMTDCPIEIVELLVSMKPSLVLITNNEEVTPLHEAVKFRRLDIVKCLVQHGANVNALDLDLENSLHLACSNTDYDTIEYLLNQTEVDLKAKNRDGVNPLCLLLVRSRNEHQDLVARCFFTLLERTYEKNPVAQSYAIKDIFQCAFLACVYSHTEVVTYLIHNVYSVLNSKYEFIKKLSEYCDGENTEFLYYILVFLHDDIDRYDKYNFPRFYEINYYMCIRSVISIIDMLFLADDAVELIITTLEHMESIEFKIQVKEFEDQMGLLLHTKFTNGLISDKDIRKLNEIFRFFLDKNFEVNSMIRSFLQSIAVAKESQEFSLESTKQVILVMIHYSTTFMTDLENWKQINDFKYLNGNIRQIIEWLASNFGNYKLIRFLDMNLLLRLKNLCRNEIRLQLGLDTRIICNESKINELGLPESLMQFIAFKT